MDIEEFRTRLRGAEFILEEEIANIRFRGEEQGKFRYRRKQEYYVGNYSDMETSTSYLLPWVIIYAMERAGKSAVDEEDGQPKIPLQTGYPVVMAIDVTDYDLKPGLEGEEEVISGPIKQEDVLLLFDDKIDFIKEIFPTGAGKVFYEQLKEAQQNAGKLKCLGRLP